MYIILWHLTYVARAKKHKLYMIEKKWETKDGQMCDRLIVQW